MSKNWESKKLKDISKITYGYTSKSSFEFNGPKYLRITDIQNNNVDWSLVPNCTIKDEEIERYQLSYGDIVFARTGATTGKSYMIKEVENSIFASYLIRVKLTDNSIIHDYLYLFFQSHSYWSSIKSGISGSAQGGFNAKKLGEMSLQIPSINEQKQIVEILDTVFEALEKAKKNIAKNLKNTKELFESKLNEIFSQKGEGWEEKDLGEVAEFRNGLNFSSSDKGESFKIVSVASFKNHFSIKTESLEEATIAGSLKDIDKLENGDILAVRSNGNPKLIGRCMIAKDINENISFSGFTIRIRLLDDNIYPLYLNYFLKSNDIRDKLVKSGNGTNIRNLNQKSLSSLDFIYPSTFNGQIKIVDEIITLEDKTKQLEQKYQEKLDNIEELKKSILEKAFCGELTK